MDIYPSAGTRYALVGTAVLCIPSLLHTHYRDFGLQHRPFLSIQDLFYLVYKADAPKYTWSLLSPNYSWLTHMFHHSHLGHFVANMYSITTSSWYLDLGFLKTSFLLLGGGLTGAAAHILEKVYIRGVVHRLSNSRTHSSSSTPLIQAIERIDQVTSDSESLSWIRSKLGQAKHNIVEHYNEYRKPVYALCGASAGAYALVGAETCLLIKDLIHSYHEMKYMKRSVYESPSRRDYVKRRFWALAFASFIRFGTLSTQLVAMIFPDLFYTPNPFMVKTVEIGHSAHVGGFIFGFIAMACFEWFGESK